MSLSKEEKDARDVRASGHDDAWGDGMEVLRVLYRSLDSQAVSGEQRLGSLPIFGGTLDMTWRSRAKDRMRDFIALVVEMRACVRGELSPQIYTRLKRIVSQLVGFESHLGLPPGYARGGYEVLVAVAADACGMGNDLQGTQYAPILDKLFGRESAAGGGDG